MPTLTVMVTWWARVIGLVTSSISRWATCSAWAREGSASHRTTNSSPPSRAAVSPSRMQASSRSAVSTSTASPASWPRLSLTSLKWSRSQNSSAIGRPVTAARARASEVLASRVARLGSPVSSSCDAWCASASCASRWALTSSIIEMKYSGAPTVSRASATVSWAHRGSPLRVR